MWFKKRRIRLFDRPREVRLLPEYAALYPRIKQGRWLTVSTARRLLSPGRGQPSTRELLCDHFEFRYGLGPRNPAGPDLRQRADDPPAVPAPSILEREARLRYPYAQSYPVLSAERWLIAREVRDDVIELREQEDETRPARDRDRMPATGRVLPDEHFDFRYGASEDGLTWLRTRREDPPFRRRRAPRGG